jgi:nucleoside phosphorylase
VISPTFCTAFFFATPSEARWLKKQLILRSRILLTPSIFYAGHPRSSPEENLLIVETGIGPRAAARAARYAFSQFKIDQAILLGVAAAANHDLKVGDIVLATESGSVSQPREEWFTPASPLREKIKKLLGAAEVSHREGLVLTVDRVIHTPEEKIQLGIDFGALALEMEAAPIAQEAKAHSVPFVQLRSILDPVAFPLPPMEGWVDERGSVHFGALIKALIQRPKLIWELPSLSIKMAQALKPMNHFLQKWFAEKH